jgi:RimJ/RimL family protein N-acetyltransferase
MTILTTARLTLAPPTRDHFPTCAALWARPEVAQHITGRPNTAEECWARVLRYAGHWALHGWGFWVVTETGTGRFVGELGFMDFRRDIDPPIGTAPEIGWVLAPEMQGRGYATEAARAALAWGRERFGKVRAVCMIKPGNTASRAVAGRLGFAEYARTTYHGQDEMLLQRML